MIEIFTEAVERAVAPPDPHDDRQRSGLRFARRIRLPRAVGLGCFCTGEAPCWCRNLSLAAGGYCWSAGLFVWPHLAWRWAAKALILRRGNLQPESGCDPLRYVDCADGRQLCCLLPPRCL